MRETANRPQRKVRLGVVGGGAGSNIGETHRYAARLDDRYTLVTGVFASDAERSRDFAATLDIAPDRRYGSWQVSPGAMELRSIRYIYFLRLKMVCQV